MADNFERIKKEFGGPDGGKSGEFFFFSTDNRLMIKTMNTDELLVFLDKLPSYN